MVKNKENIAKRFLDHPDREEIISKLLAGISATDITEWLKAKYNPISEKKFIFSEKYITSFKDEYLDFYTIMRQDLEKTKSNLMASQQIQQEIQGTPAYHKALEKYTDKEVDVKSIIKKLVVNAETRLSQMFDIMQEDPANFRADRTLVEWFNTLLAILEKYDSILNGSQDQINIQNNINIQVFDEHMGFVYNLIKEILTKLDYDTSLVFMDMLNDGLKQIKSNNTIVPVDIRLKEATVLSETITEKLNQ
jgi:cell fate (sporulation/competence/biofilm development) regulator YlbF (YheA/YmcA/DUF963 family)